MSDIKQVSGDNKQVSGDNKQVSGVKWQQNKYPCCITEYRKNSTDIGDHTEYRYRKSIRMQENITVLRNSIITGFKLFTADQAKPAQKFTDFQNSTRFLMLPYTLGLTGHDPQGGTTMEAFYLSYYTGYKSSLF